MKNFILILIATLTVAMTGCSSSSNIGCDIETKVVEGVTPMIASQLQCSNPAQIKVDLQNVMNGLNLCRPKPTSGKLELPQPICSMMANLVVGGVAKLAIPSAWGCTATNAQALLSSVIVTACTSL